MNYFLSDVSSWVPELLISSGWIEHAPFGFWLMDVLRPRVLVELGTHRGYSYFVFNQALKALNTKTRCFAVDTWEGDEHAGYYGDDVFDQVSAYNNQHYWDFSELIRSTFDEATSLFADGTIDVLHIDGRHFYEDVKHDFETWLPKLSERGVVIVHDTNVRVKDFGVYRLWDELKEQYPRFEFLHGHGLGVLGIGTVLPDLLMALFAASKNENIAQQIRNMYARLGGALLDRVELQERMEEIASVTIDRKSLEQQLSTADTELRRVSAELSERTAERDRIWSEKQWFENSLGQATENCLRIGAEVEQLRAEASRRRKEEERLESELAQEKTTEHDLESELVRRKATNRELEAALSARKAEGQALKAELSKTRAERDRLFAGLSDAVADRQKLATDLVRQKGQLNRTLSSTSWRITSPLRWTSKKAPWLRFLLLLPIRIAWWTVTLQLVRRMRFIQQSKLLLNSDLFNSNYYLEQNPDVAKSGIDPLQHFLVQGGFEGRNPHPLFDCDWYLKGNPDLASSRINPLVHYLSRGAKEGRAPHPLVDLTFYREQNPDMGAGADLLHHYLSVGGLEGLDPHPLFDSDWYLEQNQDVTSAGINPLTHYLWQGWKEGRAPHPLFDVRFYEEQNPDVARAGIEPLQHYLKRGGLERRQPHVLFDSDWYLQHSGDVESSGINPLLHYVRNGWKECRDPHPLFDVTFYQKQEPDITDVGIEPLQHYLRTGAIGERDPHPLFDSDWYLQQNPTVATFGLNPLVHYLRVGWKEGSNPHPLFDGAFYKRRYPDIARDDINPVFHYLTRGGYEGRNPHPLFDSNWYLRQNPTSAAESATPLVHYLCEGWKANSDPHPLFDGAFYRQQTPDIAWAAVNPLLHFLERSAFEGSNPHPLFDTAFYLEQNPDVARRGTNPLVHYLSEGYLAGRDPNRLFDTSFYLSQYEDVSASELNPLVHYVTFGASEGRLTNKWSGNDIPLTFPTICGQEDWNDYGRNRLNAFFCRNGTLSFSSTEPIDLSIVMVFYNKAHLSLLCLETLPAPADCTYELVIVDNNSADETQALLERCQGAKIIRNTRNVGFGEACMIGATQAKGDYILFLNNDVLLEPYALAAALRNFADPTVGAVGGKILLANGDLQEAGSIIWSDGNAYGYGRLDNPWLPQYEFRRPVDYCSAAFLFTPRSLFFKLGGFDPIYAPAYYEDADYCMKVWEAGLRVIYDPSCVIRHFESASSGGNDSARPLMAANRHKFVSRWKERLSTHCPPNMDQAVRARIASQSPRLRVLYLDDRIPHPLLGAGFPRSNEILHQLAAQGHCVTSVAVRFPIDSTDVEYRDLPREIELFDGTQNVDKLFKEYVPAADLIWVSRPHNFELFLDRVMEHGGLSAKVVYDAEAIFSNRDRLAVDLRQRLVPSTVLDARLTRELALAQAADAVVVVSARDRDTMKRGSVSNIHILSYSLIAKPTENSYEDRNTFLFVGAIHGHENPNADAIRYFCDEIWPDVYRQTDGELVIAGFGTDHYLGSISGKGIRIVGPTEDLTPLYNSARVFVAPTRYSAGIPLKVQEAASRGVPAVVSSLIGKQLGWEDQKEVLIAKDSAAFSAFCCELYLNKGLWDNLRKNALERICSELNPESFAEKVSLIFASVLSRHIEGGAEQLNCSRSATI